MYEYFQLADGQWVVTNKVTGNLQEKKVFSNGRWRYSLCEYSDVNDLLMDYPGATICKEMML